MHNLTLLKSAWLHVKFALGAHVDGRESIATMLFHKACDLELIATGSEPVFFGEHSHQLARTILKNQSDRELDTYEFTKEKGWKRIEAFVTPPEEANEIEGTFEEITTFNEVHVG